MLGCPLHASHASVGLPLLNHLKIRVSPSNRAVGDIRMMSDDVPKPLMRSFEERGFGSIAALGNELPTRELDVPPIKVITNAALSSGSTVALVSLGFVFNYFFFPIAAAEIVPFAFNDEVYETLGRGLGTALDAERSAQVGRPVAGEVLKSVAVPATGILFATLSSTTLGTLRARQQDLRTSLRKECTAFETVLMPIRKLFRADPHRYSRALCLLLQYTEDVMADTSSLTDQRLKSSLFDSERAGMLAVLAVIGEVPIYL